MRVLLLDCPLDTDRGDQYPFRSEISVWDYDVVIWDPARSINTYRSYYPPTYRGLRRLDESDSAALERDIVRRHKEFKEFVEAGKTLVLFAAAGLVVFADSGEREYSGTGKNRHTTIKLGRADILETIPLAIDFTQAVGIELEIADSVISPLWRATYDDWQYRAIIHPERGKKLVGKPLLRVKNTDKVAAHRVQHEGGGMIIILPEFWGGWREVAAQPDTIDEASIEIELDDSQSDEGAPEGDEDEQATADESTTQSTRSSIEAVEKLLEWLDTLTSDTEQETPPAWLDQFAFSEDLTRSKALADLEREVGAIREKIDGIKKDQSQSDAWKTLIFSQGTPLERQVSEALQVLGFEILDSTPGRSDIRAAHGEHRIVVEVKGIARSAAEKHSAQLEKWVAEELEEEKVAKGVLVVNAWRETPLDQREAAFPHQMLNYAERRDHCLMTGLQLLSMVRSVQAGRLDADACAQAILTTSGPLAGFDLVEDIFESREQKLASE